MSRKQLDLRDNAHSELPERPTLRFRTLGWLAVLACSMLASTALAQVSVAAAADLRFAMPELAAAFERAGGGKLQVSFGSSGNFRRQIGEGAPFEIFFSADEAYADALIAEGRAQAPGALYGIGRIVLFVPRGSRVKTDATLKDLSAAASDGRLARLAIANPEHAPYGRAAREAMQKTGVYPIVQDKLVLGENVGQAARFATSGAAQAGILPLALMAAPEIADQGSHVVLDASLHAPLRQKAVLIKGAGETARRFFDFVRSPAGADILARYGFAPPR
jgi:molybdate transport system substrate-binding protein